MLAIQATFWSDERKCESACVGIPPLCSFKLLKTMRPVSTFCDLMFAPESVEAERPFFLSEREYPAAVHR